MRRDLVIDVQARGTAVFREREERGSADEAAHRSLPKATASARPQSPRASEPEEDLIPDERAELRPSQWVERKLVALLSDAPVPLSHIRLASVVRGRRPEK